MKNMLAVLFNLLFFGIETWLIYCWLLTLSFSLSIMRAYNIDFYYYSFYDLIKFCSLFGDLIFNLRYVQIHIFFFCDIVSSLHFVRFSFRFFELYLLALIKIWNRIETYICHILFSLYSIYNKNIIQHTYIICQNKFYIFFVITFLQHYSCAVVVVSLFF